MNLARIFPFSVQKTNKRVPQTLGHFRKCGLWLYVSLFISIWITPSKIPYVSECIDNGLTSNIIKLSAKTMIQQAIVQWNRHCSLYLDCVFDAYAASIIPKASYHIFYYLVLSRIFMENLKKSFHFQI